MNTGQWIVFTIVFAIVIYAYFELAYSFSPIKQLRGMLGLMLLMLVTIISMFLVFITSSQNEKLRNQNKDKCPEYVPIQNVYILKE